MLVNIPANRQRVVAVSFPRDLAINPIQCEAWNPETGKYGPIYDEKTGTMGPKMVYTETKLNSAFSFGGPKCLVKVIQKLSGLAINRFIAVDFVGFARMVEAIGGVEVCTTTPLRDYELGTVLERAGRQKIDGQTALNYVRARQVTTESNGDYGRIKRQQRFLSSLLRSMISEDTLLNLNKLNNAVNIFIGNSYVDNVKTRDLVELGRSLQHMAAGHVTFVTVPTGITDQDGNEPPRTADMKALFTAIINDEPLPKENDHNAQTLGSTPRPRQAPPRRCPGESRQRAPARTADHNVAQRGHGAGLQRDQHSRSGRHGRQPAQEKRLQRDDAGRLSEPAEGHHGVLLTRQRAGRSHRRRRFRQLENRAGDRDRPSGASGPGPGFQFGRLSPPTGSSVSIQVTRGSATTPTKLPEDLTVTNAADTTCE